MAQSTLHSITYPDIPVIFRPSIIEHNGKLFCTMGKGVYKSKDGIFWDFVCAGGTSLASFQGKLWLCNNEAYSPNFQTSDDEGKTWNPVFKSPPLFTECCTVCSMITHTSPNGVEKLIVVYGGNQGPVGVLDGSPQSITVGLGLNYTTDGKTWSNDANPTLGGYSTFSDKSKPFSTFMIPPYSMALTSYNGTLYCICQPPGDSWESNPAPYLVAFDDDTNCFISPFNRNFPDGTVDNSSIVNTGDSLWYIFWDGSYYGYMAYMESQDGKAWGKEINCFPNIYTRMGVTGLTFNNDLFIANSLCDSNLNNGKFNIITNKKNLDLKHDIFKPTTYVINAEKKLSITTLCPRVHIKSVSCYIALGKGSDGNYYYVSFNQYNTTQPAYFQLPEKPSPIVKKPDVDTWLCFTSGNKLYIVDPATPTNHPSFNLSGNDLLAPVCGATENEIIVRDSNGTLFVGHVESVTSSFHFSPQSYQLSPAGDISPIAIDQYLYLYNKTDDTLEIYNMSTSEYGTPVCTTNKLGLSSAPIGSDLQVTYNGSYILASISEGNSTQNLLIEQFQTGASELNSNRIIIEPISPQKANPQ